MVLAFTTQAKLISLPLSYTLFSQKYMLVLGTQPTIGLSPPIPPTSTLYIQWDDKTLHVTVLLKLPHSKKNLGHLSILLVTTVSTPVNTENC